MRLPSIRGVIDRRILVNYRVDPDALKRFLPEPFRPKLANGMGVAGICLIRLTHIRPHFLPAAMGISSENAAHRIAVEWESDGEHREGVYIPRRDTSSRLNALVGGRFFPGLHHHARFVVREQDDYYRVVLDSDEGKTHLAVEGRVVSEWPGTSIFHDVSEASEFFERGSLGYSATDRPGRFDAIELRTFNWQVQPLSVERLESSFFENREVFPPGTAELDCGLLMRGIDHAWISRESLCAGCAAEKRLELRPEPARS